LIRLTMVRCISLLAAFMFSTIVFAQQQSVNWNFNSVKLTGDEYAVHLSAVIPSGCHIYSMLNKKIDSMMLMDIEIEQSNEFDLIGSIREYGKAVTNFDPVFRRPLTWYENSVLFVQKLKLDKPCVRLKGSLIFLVCDLKTNFETEEISFEIEIIAVDGISPKKL